MLYLETIIIKCPSCGQDTDKGNMTEYNGAIMCEGCAEGIADAEYYTDPHGRNWTNNPE